MTVFKCFRLSKPKSELTLKFNFLTGLVLARHDQYESIYPSVHSLYLFLSFSLSMLSPLLACSINGFSCIIWVGVLELMDWGGWHGFQSHSSCPVPFCKNSRFLASTQLPTPTPTPFLSLILFSAPFCLGSSPPKHCVFAEINSVCLASAQNGTEQQKFNLLF